jgi:hypothetical protein
VVNVVTRSGSNQLRDSLLEFYRDTSLNTTNAIIRLNRQPKAPYHYHQFGSTAGGAARQPRFLLRPMTTAGVTRSRTSRS